MDLKLSTQPPISELRSNICLPANALVHKSRQLVHELLQLGQFSITRNLVMPGLNAPHVKSVGGYSETFIIFVPVLFKLQLDIIVSTCLQLARIVPETNTKFQEKLIQSTVQ